MVEITQEQYDSLLAEVSSLRKEKEEMKALLLEHRLSYERLSDGEKGCIARVVFACGASASGAWS